MLALRCRPGQFRVRPASRTASRSRPAARWAGPAGGTGGFGGVAKGTFVFLGGTVINLTVGHYGQSTYDGSGAEPTGGGGGGGGATFVATSNSNAGPAPGTASLRPAAAAASALVRRPAATAPRTISMAATPDMATGTRVAEPATAATHPEAVTARAAAAGTVPAPAMAVRPWRRGLYQRQYARRLADPAGCGGGIFASGGFGGGGAGSCYGGGGGGGWSGGDAGLYGGGGGSFVYGLSSPGYSYSPNGGYIGGFLRGDGQWLCLRLRPCVGSVDARAGFTGNPWRWPWPRSGCCGVGSGG